MFLDSNDKSECFGCESCVQACNRIALSMVEDNEGFRYPILDSSLCVNCGLCRNLCPFENIPTKYEDNKFVFGGYTIDKQIRFESTSGGAFSAIAEAYCDDNYVIFGAESKGLSVFHSYIFDKRDLSKFRKSKYSQSVIGSAYKDAKRFLSEGKKVLFSGTPCQIAGLLAFLGNVNKVNLLTIEVVCEGVPSPLYIRKMDDSIKKKFGVKINSLDYRYTGKNIFSNGTWDFEKMKIDLLGKNKSIIKDRWFNPFWSIWLQHLMSRPSCYSCKFTSKGRVADITLGDLWGVHIYCPELYGKNGGSSLIVCNTELGKKIFLKTKPNMYGHELAFEDAIKFQGPMRKPIENNPKRSEFIADLQSCMDFNEINKKWAKKPSLNLLINKYIYGNRQRVFIWNLKHRNKMKV